MAITENLGAAIKASCTAGLASCVSGADLFALIGAVAGVGLAMAGQTERSIPKLLFQSYCLIVLSVGCTWFIAESVLPAIHRFGAWEFELVRGRMFVAGILGYFMQAKLLPGVEQVFGVIKDRLVASIERRKTP